MTSSHPFPVACQWFFRLAAALDRRTAPRLALLFLGAILARGRRTVTSWIRAARLSGQFRPCYTIVAAGKKADSLAARLLIETVKPLVADTDRIDLIRRIQPGARLADLRQRERNRSRSERSRLSAWMSPSLVHPR